LELDIKKIREDFPILSRQVYNKPLVYFDNGATTHKPKCVIDIINQYHTFRNSSIHRGIHYLSDQATNDYENARKTVQKFINAEKPEEIIFTSGTTGSINGLAFSFGEKYIKAGDEIIISEMEHHANIVPWQMLAERKNAFIKVIPFYDDGSLDIDTFQKLINEKTRIIAITYVSNILGTVNPIKKITEIAHKHNIPVFIDAAQAIQHKKIDVIDLDCDFLAFSGHKIYGPTGIGVLYGKEKYLDELPPFQGGGDMIEEVTFEKTTFAKLPLKFEAGTTNYIGAIGMAEALKYINNIGIENIAEYENKLRDYSFKILNEIEGITVFGTTKDKISIHSFLIKGIHPYDAGMILDKLGIAVRTGTHCGQPIMKHYKIDGNIRISLVFYNTTEELDIFKTALIKLKSMF
jgi:cysteine desulfurase/selenocysteine lyase